MIGFRRFEREGGGLRLGILSFFALQAGARKVYAIEGSSVAEYCEVNKKE